MSWDVLRGCGPPETPYFIAPVQTFLRIARRHLPDEPVIQIIGFLLWYAQLHELVRRTTRRVLFDPVDCMLQLVNTNASGQLQIWRIDRQAASVDVGRTSRLFEWADAQPRLPI